MSAPLAVQLAFTAIGLAACGVIVLAVRWIRGSVTERCERAYGDGWEDCLSYNPYRRTGFTPGQFARAQKAAEQFVASHGPPRHDIETWQCAAIRAGHARLASQPAGNPPDRTGSTSSARHQKRRRRRLPGWLGTAWRALRRRLPQLRHHVGPPAMLP